MRFHKKNNIDCFFYTETLYSDSIGMKSAKYKPYGVDVPDSETERNGVLERAKGAKRNCWKLQEAEERHRSREINLFLFF